MMMNSDNDNMIPLMMMMTMGNNQYNILMPVLIMSMMNKDNPSKSKCEWLVEEQIWSDASQDG